MNERIKELREALNLTQQEFAEKIGITRSAISNIEKGNRNASEQVILLVCKEFNANEDWLRDGTGEMFITMDEDEKLAAFAASILKEKEDSFKRRFIAAFSDLTDDEWELLEKLHDKMFFDNKKED